MNVYIAGPMRGYPEFNFPAFFAAEEFLNAQGHATFNPARRDVEEYGEGVNDSPTGDLADVPQFDLRTTLAADTAWICASADAIFMLPGWAKSSGARAEKALAEALGLPVLFRSPLSELETTPDFDAGYDLGYEDGHDVGFDLGFSEGLAAGEDA